MKDFTPFDRFVKQSILSCPSMFSTRADVMRHSFIQSGNGLSWRGGVLNRSYEFDYSEQVMRKRFFEDFDEELKEHKKNRSDRTSRKQMALEYARRRFLLDHINLISSTPEPIYLTVTYLIDSYSKVGWTLMNMPEDCEPSFRAACREMFKEITETLSLNMEHGAHVRAEVLAEYHRQFPVTPGQIDAANMINDILLEILNPKEGSSQ